MGGVFVLLCRMLPKAGSSEETGALCHRGQRLDGAVTVECVALSPAGPECMSSEKCLGAESLRSMLPLPGPASFGLLAACLLPWWSVTHVAGSLPCGMSALILGAAKLLVFSVILFLVTRL